MKVNKLKSNSSHKVAKNIYHCKLSTVKQMEELKKAKNKIALLKATINSLNMKIISLKAENDVLRLKCKDSENEGVPGKTYIGTNIDEFVRYNPDIVKEITDFGYKVYCSKCHNEKIPWRKEQSFENFIEIKGDDCSLINNGKNAKWNNFKKRLTNHIASHPTIPIRIESQRNLLMLALTVVKMKGTEIHFEQLMSLLKVLNVNIGEFVHSGGIFPKMLMSFQKYLADKLSLFLRTPLQTTGLPPHFAIALDKGILSRTSNQPMLVLINTGCRIAIPVDCSIVYSFENSELRGSKTVDYINQCLNNFLATLNLDQEHLSHITAVYADGNFFQDTFKDKVGFKYNDYFISLCDYVHWIDIEVQGVINTTFLRDFIRRCNTVHNFFGNAKSCEDYKSTAGLLNSEAYETNDFNLTHFSSSYINVLKSFLETYPTLVKTLGIYKGSSSEFDEIKCLLKGADFPMDLCAAIDILSPLTQIMEAVQSISYVPWSFIRAMNLILERLLLMHNDLNTIINGLSYQPSILLFPVLGERWKELLQKRNDSQYFCSWVKVERNSSNDSSGVWRVRDIKDCLIDYSNLCSQLHEKFKERFENNVGKHIAQFGLCFDMNQHLEELVYLLDFSEEEKFELLRNIDKQSIPHFNQIYNYLRTLAHLEDHLNLDSWIVFKNWKSCFRDLIFNHSHTFGNWFVDNKDEPVKLNDVLVSIRKEESKNLFIQTYTLILDDQSHISGVRFSESNMITFLLSDMEYFTSKQYPRELRIVLDYVFSTCGSEACVEGFYNVLKTTKQKNSLVQHEVSTLLSIIDWVFPVANKCINTCEDLAKTYIFGDNKMNLNLSYLNSSQSKASKQYKKYKWSQVCNRIDDENHKISFILNENDLKTQTI